MRATTTHKTKRLYTRKQGSDMSDPKCRCSNHMGTPKVAYRTREQAVKQLCWHSRKARGATFTIVTCKSDPDVLHIISSREAKK